MPAAAPRRAVLNGVFLLRSAREASLLREASVDNAGAQALRPLRRERFVRSQTTPRVLQTFELSFLVSASSADM